MQSSWVNQNGLAIQDALMLASAQNLSNISVYGYKKSRVLTSDQFYTTLRQAGAEVGGDNKSPTGIQMGSGARVVGTQKIFSQGSQESTKNPLDVAILGNGFFQIQKPSGDLAYTRNGQFTLDADGQLVMTSGLLIDPGITIPRDAETISIAEDGVVTVSVPGQADMVDVGQLTLVTFMNPSGLSALGDHLYSETEASGEPEESVPGENGVGLLKQYTLEASNVDMVEELVNLIRVQRNFEITAKSIKAENDAEEYLVRQT